MLRKFHVGLLSVLVLIGMKFAALQAVEEVLPVAIPTEEQLKTWAGQLGDPDFAKREAAQAGLTRAGLPALPWIETAQSSPDPEVKGAARRIYNKLRWLKIPDDINYLSVLPPHTLGMLYTPKYSELAKQSKKTVLSQLLDHPALKVLKEKVTKELNQQLAAINLPLRTKANAAEADSPMGQVVISAWLEPGAEEASILMLMEMKVADPKLVMNFAQQRLEKLGIRTTPTPIDGIDAVTLHIQDIKMVLALIGRHFMITTSEALVKQTARALLQPPENSLASDPAYVAAQKSLGDGSHLTFMLNFKAIKRGVEQEKAEAAFMPLLAQLGVQDAEHFLINTYVVGDHFEDRFAVNSTSAPQGLMRLAALGTQHTQALPEALATVPADAVGVATVNLDGATMSKLSQDFARTLEKVFEGEEEPEEVAAPGAALPPVVLPPAIAPAAVETSEIETALGFTFAQTAALVKGSGVSWMRMPEMLGVPELGGALPCKTDDDAKTLADRIAKALDYESHVKAEEDWAMRNELIRLGPGKFVPDEEEAPEEVPGAAGLPPAVPGKGDEKVEALKPDEKIKEAKPDATLVKDAPKDPATKPDGEKPLAKDAPKKPEPNYEELKKIEKGIVVLEENGRTYYTESDKGPQITLEESRQNVPYRLSWTAQGSRVIFASSLDVLKKRIEALEKKEAGLELAKLLPDGTQVPAQAGILALDLKRVLLYGQRYGLPALTMLATIQGKSDEAKMLGDLAANTELFKTVPPIFATVTQEGNTLRGTIQSPLPTLPVVSAAFLVGSMWFTTRMVQEEKEATPAPKADDF